MTAAVATAEPDLAFLNGRRRDILPAMAAESPRPGPSVLRVPEGDDRPRMTCPDCGFIAYENPKVVVGSVVLDGDRILLCRRAIEPRRGYWTLPAGYLELQESTEAGAQREAWEEARARIALDGVLAVYNIPRISQVQVIYRARLVDPAIAPGPESLEVALFRWEEIPWADLAFPSVHWALRHWRESDGAADFAARSNPPGETGKY
jgi:ADP-ribose pyrophosphatase YjhB (NUDIX family)